MGKMTKEFFAAATELACKKEELAAAVNGSIFTKGARKLVAADKSNAIYAATARNYEQYLGQSEMMCVVMRLIIKSTPNAERKLQDYMASIGAREDTSMLKDMIAEYGIDPDMFAGDDTTRPAEDAREEEEIEDDEEYPGGSQESTDAADIARIEEENKTVRAHIKSDPRDEVVDVNDKRQYKRKQERLRYALRHAKIDAAEYGRQLAALKAIYGVKR